MLVSMRYIFLLVFITLPLIAHAESFDQWKVGYAQRAVAAGLTATQVENALYNVSFDDRVIELDRKQPEGHMTLLEYVEKTVTDRRAEKGQRLLNEHYNLLDQVERASGVSKFIIMALWAKETDFGAVTGNFNIVDSLATLAYEGPPPRDVRTRTDCNDKTGLAPWAIAE
jgi:membrane-bound lytic murein transglycosylase B